jgi:hypothetical protein
MGERKQGEPWQGGPCYDGQLRRENMRKNAGLLRGLEGKFVAWYPDGSGIRDIDANSIELWDRIRLSGEWPTTYYFEYVEPPRAEGEPLPRPWWLDDFWHAHHFWMANREHNLDLLLPYDGKTVAWFPDGNGIRDADENPFALQERIKASGEDPNWYHYEYVSTMAQI